MAEGQHPPGELQARSADRIIREAQAKHGGSLDASKSSTNAVPQQEYLSIPPGELQARSADRIIREAQTKQDNFIDPELRATLKKLEVEYDEERKKRWEQVAVPEYAKRLGLNPRTLTPVERKILASCDPYTIECAKRLGLNPLTLTPEERKRLDDSNPFTIQYAQGLGLNPLTLTPEEVLDVTYYGEKILKSAKELGLNPRTLTPVERKELASWERILTPEERKEHAEYVKEAGKYRGRPLTQEEMERFMQYGGHLRNGQSRHTLGEVIQRILEMIGKGIKAITSPRKGKQ